MSERAERIVDTLVGLDPLADLPRTGWLLRGIRPCESIADHSYFVAVTVMLLVDALREEGTAVDGEKALRMALVHDAPEAKTGDVPMPQKTERMDAALEELEEGIAARLLPEPQQRSWREAEDGTSLEARIVKAADKIQMMTKALVYGEQGRGICTSSGPTTRTSPTRASSWPARSSRSCERGTRARRPSSDGDARAPFARGARLAGTRSAARADRSARRQSSPARSARGSRPARRASRFSTSASSSSRVTPRREATWCASEVGATPGTNW